MPHNAPFPVVENKLGDLGGFAASGLSFDASDALLVNRRHQSISMVENRETGHVDRKVARSRFGRSAIVTDERLVAVHHGKQIRVDCLDKVIGGPRIGVLTHNAIDKLEGEC